jgi:hypothetical protein
MPDTGRSASKRTRRDSLRFERGTWIRKGVSSPRFGPPPSLSDRDGSGGFGSTDESGAFVIEGIAEGEYAVEITARDFLPEALSSVRVTAGNVSELGTIRLRKGGVIEGTVTNASEEPVPGASVRAVVPGFRPYVVVDDGVSTDRLGRFRIGGLADGKVQLAASHPEYAETRLEDVEVDSTSRGVGDSGRAAPGGRRRRNRPGP